MNKEYLDRLEMEKMENNTRKLEDIKRDKIGLDVPDEDTLEDDGLRESLRLNYVDTVDNSERVQVCYFSIEDPTLVRGDDWGDVPYEHNAGIPSSYDYYQIAINATAPSFGHLNSPYSVEMINRGEVPWLTDEDGNKLYAGSTLREFVDFMKKAPYGMYL